MSIPQIVTCTKSPGFCTYIRLKSQKFPQTGVVHFCQFSGVLSLQCITWMIATNILAKYTTCGCQTVSCHADFNNSTSNICTIEGADCLLAIWATQKGTQNCTTCWLCREYCLQNSSIIPRLQTKPQSTLSSLRMAHTWWYAIHILNSWGQCNSICRWNTTKSVWLPRCWDFYCNCLPCTAEVCHHSQTCHKGGFGETSFIHCTIDTCLSLKALIRKHWKFYSGLARYVVTHSFHCNVP